MAHGTAADSHFRLGLLLVVGSALAWSFGGTIARFISDTDIWTVVFWRSLFASLFLLGFMLWREGVGGTVSLFRNMGLPGVAVACCFAIASTSFIVALSYTTVANVLLIQAGVPLLAALLSWLVYGERVSLETWVAIVAVILGVGVMVSESLSGDVSLIGNGLAILIALLFSVATVITRRHSNVRMTPATCLGTMLGCAFGAISAGHFVVSMPDLAWLVLFGAVNLGLGLAFFATGGAAHSSSTGRVDRHAGAGAGADLGMAHSWRGCQPTYHCWRQHGLCCPYRTSGPRLAEAAPQLA